MQRQAHRKYKADLNNGTIKKPDKHREKGVAGFLWFFAI